MTKTIVHAFWTGGGVWGHSQLMNAKNIVDQTQIHLADIIDIHTAGSIGNVPALATAIKQPYQIALENFRKCANDMMDGGLRAKQLKRSVIHSLRRIDKCGRYNPKSLILKDHTGSIHLNHDILNDFLNASLSDMQLKDLETAFVSFAHHQETNDRICFAHGGKSNLFDEQKWAVVPNHGSHHSISDIVMASTAAPSVFGSHQIGNGHYIDCATVCTPLSTIKNIFRMVENPDNTKIELLFFGAGFVADDSWNADLYRNQGLLEIINDWSSSLGYGNLKQDMREIEADYGDRVQITFIDTPVPKTYKNEIFLHDSFNGSLEYIDAIEDVTQQNLAITGGYYARSIERIAEQKEQENSVDPLASEQRPSFLDRLINRNYGGAKVTPPITAKPS